MRVTILLALLCAGCPPEKPACSPEALPAIEAAYIDEAVRACDHSNYDECPELPAIRAKYAARRAAYVECQ